MTRAYLAGLSAVAALLLQLPSAAVAGAPDPEGLLGDSHESEPETAADKTAAPGEGTAQPEPATGDPEPVSAKDVADAPRPHETRGLATPDPSRETSVVRTVGRGLLSLPRWGFELAMQPVRGALYAYERYQLNERFKRIFFNETGTFGVFPSFFFETGFGLNAGVRMVHRDLSGAQESVKLRGGWGGEYTQRYELSADSGERMGRVQLELSGQIEIRDRDRFAGIGNRDLADPADVMSPIDPLGNEPVLESRYRQRFSRLWGGASVRVTEPLSVRASVGIIDRKLSDQNVNPRSDVVISDAYDISTLPGFAEDPRLAYGELEVRLSTKRRASRYVPEAWSGTGWDLRAFGGYADGLGGDTWGFFRYGVDLQRYINLFGGTRVLVVRLYGEGVSDGPGPNVPFTELPTLGGDRILRGYPESRFRDRYVGTGSAEYQFDVNAGSYAFLFADAGKVMPVLDSEAFEDLRLGFGGGFQINSEKSFLARILVAGSKDGDLLLSLTVEPQFELDERFDRR